MSNWLLNNWLDLVRLWAALIGTGCFGLAGVLAFDRFSGHHQTEDADAATILAEPSY